MKVGAAGKEKTNWRKQNKIVMGKRNADAE
jgi:hypothetical protein